MVTIISSDISKAVSILDSNDVVAIPTETVYGLAGNIYSEAAVRRIFEVKQRPLFNPLIVHVSSIEQVEKIASEFPDKARKLATTFWPGPLTLILEKTDLVPDMVTAGKSTVAVRMPDHPVAQSLLQALDYPLAAPSANPFNTISPTTALHVENYFKDKISMVLDGGSCEAGIESTIVGFDSNDTVIYRLGSISVEDIEAVVGAVRIKNEEETAPEAPGMFARHYSPETKMKLVDDVATCVKEQSDKKIGLLLFSDCGSYPEVGHAEVLSRKGDLREAAANLYEALHKLDRLGLDLIVAEKMPEEGLGRSINDRLKRASS